MNCIYCCCNYCLYVDVAQRRRKLALLQILHHALHGPLVALTADRPSDGGKSEFHASIPSNIRIVMMATFFVGALVR